MIAAVLAVLVIAAAGSAVYLSRGNSLPPCGSNQPLFSVLPVSSDDTVVLTPLGQMSPPDHVFPAPHQYIYVIDPTHPLDKEAPVYSPGDMVLTLGAGNISQLGPQILEQLATVDARPDSLRTRAKTR